MDLNSQMSIEVRASFSAVPQFGLANLIWDVG